MAPGRRCAAPGVDAVADVHGVLRSVMFRTALWLRGVPVAAIEKGREEKKEFIRKVAVT